MSWFALFRTWRFSCLPLSYFSSRRCMHRYLGIHKKKSDWLDCVGCSLAFSHNLLMRKIGLIFFCCTASKKKVPYWFPLSPVTCQRGDLKMFYDPFLGDIIPHLFFMRDLRLRRLVTFCHQLANKICFHDFN
jgi:hypothetical protein